MNCSCRESESHGGPFPDDIVPCSTNSSPCVIISYLGDQMKKSPGIRSQLACNTYTISKSNAWEEVVVDIEEANPIVLAQFRTWKSWSHFQDLHFPFLQTTQTCTEIWYQSRKFKSCRCNELSVLCSCIAQTIWMNAMVCLDIILCHLVSPCLFQQHLIDGHRMMELKQENLSIL